MCGVVGIAGKRPVNRRIYDALTALQHRGQDAAGIATSEGGRLNLRRGSGLVRDVFRADHMQRLKGNIGIGHVRYPTQGTYDPAEAQPMYVNSPYGITLAHNGNLTNAEQLKRDLFRADLRHVNTNSDSEILLNVLAHELQRQGRLTPEPEDVFAAIAGVHARCNGAYAAVALIIGYGIVGFRDCHGIRPLVLGKRETEHGTEYMIASESVALDVLEFTLVRDVAPGEAVYIDVEGNLHTQVCAAKTQLSPCIFEHVYLASPPSFIDDISVYKARLRMGEKLAERILGHYSRHDHDIDVVIPIPDTGRTAALPMAHMLDVKYREGFIKNRYIGRTFIMPGQDERQQSVRQKHHVIELEFKGKNVLLVEDSIVRGTTTEHIVQIARNAGANKVYLASAAPPVRYPNVYGIDLPAAQEFVAYQRTEEEVAKIIGADWLVYQSVEDLVSCAREGNPSITQFECSVFDGHYVTGDVDEGYLRRLSTDRSDDVKQLHESTQALDAAIELHN